MSQDKPSVIERTYQETLVWIKEISSKLHREDDLDAGYHALRSVLQTVRDALIPDEAMDLASQLPTMVRGIYFEGYKISDKPVTYRHQQDFLDAVNQSIGGNVAPSLDPTQCATAVFETLQEHLSAGEVEQVRKMLHKEVQQLWP